MGGSRGGRGSCEYREGGEIGSCRKGEVEVKRFGHKCRWIVWQADS